MKSSTITPEESGAFVAMVDLAPCGSGPLDGTTFAVKDLIDVAGWKTGCGNPTWRDTHPEPPVHAVCVEQMLLAGARCVGKTVTDELAFSLLGQNAFYGTPLNPRARDRVPGGSSSGSASAVACGLVDFALGTDTGGSVRVPASNCGIWGIRPSHGVASLAGIMPFAPGFDTVGVLAASADVLARAARVLLACPPPATGEPAAIHVLDDAFALADPEVLDALRGPLDRLRERFPGRVRSSSLSAWADGGDFATWCDTFCVIQWSEIWSSLGAWIEEAKPELGPATAENFSFARELDRGRIAEAVERRERWARTIAARLGPDEVLCMPTTPALAPRRGEFPARSPAGTGYYPRALALTSVAGLARLPQVSLPLGEHAGVPVGLSLLGRHGEDAFVLELARRLAA